MTMYNQKGIILELNTYFFKNYKLPKKYVLVNKNGDLIQYLNRKNIDIQYNCLNLPGRIEFEDGNSISYLYDANGTKLRTTHIIDGITTTTDYCGNVIYENEVAKTLLTESGYVSLKDGKYHYYLKDHQGNNRIVVDEDGMVEERNDYYPFGGLMTSSMGAIQPYKYNGKELDRKGVLDWYDYGARLYDPLLGRFVTIDPLAENSYFVNPYTYCLNNPFNRVDPSGLSSHYNWDSQRYEDERGNEVSWESVQQEYGITENPSNDDPPTSKDVDAVTGVAPKASIEVPTPAKATVVAPTLPWWALTGEILGNATMRYFGSYFFIVTLLQSDTDGPPVYVKEANNVKKKKSSAEADYGKSGVEHTSNQSPHNKNVHQKGRKRVQVDRGGEKGDSRRIRYK